MQYPLNYPLNYSVRESFILSPVYTHFLTTIKIIIPFYDIKKKNTNYSHIYDLTLKINCNDVKR